MAVTRTIGPLHFEDLEPKRFEDLVRQLVYDFKTWRRLEATGRAGSDDGFDARGYEIVMPEDIESTEEEVDRASEADRLWLIQCKREKTITPAKLRSHLQEIKLGGGESLHGLILAAACDFSKRAREEFQAFCEANEIKEWHLWGKGELEDLLFLPKNDALLFAYFGVSLTIRRRTLRTELRSRLAVKRKAHRVLEEFIGRDVLLRAPEATAYPHSADAPDFDRRPSWFLATYKGLSHSGLLFTVRRHFAFLNDAGNGWDAAFVLNDGKPRDDPWAREQEDFQLRTELWREWEEFPKQNRAWFELHGVVPFDSIVEIDDIGDDYFESPHVYTLFTGDAGPFSRFHAVVEVADRFIGRGALHPLSKEDGRIEAFKPERREEGPWQAYAAYKLPKTSSGE